MDVVYSKGFYNKFNDEEQWIRISEGCPNNCEFCREMKENGNGEIYYPIPEIVRNFVKIMDMNITYKSKFIEIVDYLGSQRVNGKIVNYELICGIDYRYMTQEKADALKRNRFVNIRLAWDHSYLEQKRIRDCIKILKNAGYKTGDHTDITVFIICNWKRSFLENMQKLEHCKVWGVKVSDCWFNNQVSPNIAPIYWKPEEIMLFRKKCRKHNQLIINNGVDPEINCNQLELLY